VADLERSVAFYRRVLGMSVLEDAAGRADRASLGPAGGEALVELHEHPGAAPVPRRGRLGLFHFAILLPDRPALGRLLRHLGEVGVRPGASDHLVSEALYLNDPDGLGIEVYADRPRSAWRERNGELVMATEPLDTESVLEAAEGGSWDGMPAGSTMGHVHLHVGDLGRASAFYHEGLGLGRTVWSYSGALFLSAGGYHHHLGLNTWAAGAAPAREGDARLLEWELIVPTADDADEALGALEAAGHAVERDAGGGLVRDPWGTALGVRVA
jgi:catechol 2,3-dioxygenase